MISKPRHVQILCFLLAAAFLGGAGMLTGPIDRIRRDANMITPENQAVLKKNPQLAILTSMPGGLRAVVIPILWIRSQQAHQEGRHYDAYQMADMICNLQPYCSGVWAFHAWNMAWNISVTTDTPEERWRWIENGIRLLRDRGIPLNPRSLVVYKELSWIFLTKVGGRIDEMHWTYKQRWAGKMQQLLGAPPFFENASESLAQQTQLTIDAFRPIASAPLTRDLARRGTEEIQADALQTLLKDSQIRKAAQTLKALGVGVDASLLKAFNRFSLDPSASVVRNRPPDPKTPDEVQLARWINDPASAEVLGKLLAFVRAQTLWNEYKMDPDYMLDLMEHYEIPLDWRSAMGHALYWASIGIRNCRPDDPSDMEVLNNNRNILNALKRLTEAGWIALRNNRRNPDYPFYNESPDLRYIEPTHQQHLTLIAQLLPHMDPRRGTHTFEDNLLASGHVNCLIDSMKMLVADGRIDEAQKYLDWTKENYKRPGPLWENELVTDFVTESLREDGHIRMGIIARMLPFTFKGAYLARGLSGNHKAYRKQMKFAADLYQRYQSQSVERLKLPPFTQAAGHYLGNLLSSPETFALRLDTEQRSEIYRAMGDRPEILLPVYHRLERFFKILCQRAGLDPAEAFPPPRGLSEYRQTLRDAWKAPSNR